VPHQQLSSGAGRKFLPVYILFVGGGRADSAGNNGPHNVLIGASGRDLAGMLTINTDRLGRIVGRLG